MLGLVWNEPEDPPGIIRSYLMGYITMLAVFEALGVPMVFLRVRFRIQVWVYSAAILIIILLLSVKKLSHIPIKEWWKDMSVWEYIYLGLFLIALGVQIYYTIFYDMGWWTSDDGGYVAMSSAAIHDDYAFLTNFMTGEFEYHDGGYKYIYSAIYVFYAYLSYVTGFHVAILEHSIVSVLMILMAYGAYYLLAELLIEEKENRFLFLFFLALFFLFGRSSIYSATVRLLGPSWPGKAILATVFLPLILWYYPRAFRMDFSWKRLGFIVILSLAAVCMTLGGIVTMAVAPGILALIAFIGDRKPKKLLYYPAGLVLPALIAMNYLRYR